MAHVDPGELKYRIGIRTVKRDVDDNGHYTETTETTYARAAMRSSTGRDRVEDGAYRSEDTVQFIVRWGVRQKVIRDSVLFHRGNKYHVDWMDDAPWAENYARIRAISYDRGEG